MLATASRLIGQSCPTTSSTISHNPRTWTKPPVTVRSAPSITRKVSVQIATL